MLLLFAGFLIPPNDMSPAFGWLHHINPMFYGFENVGSMIESGVSREVLNTDISFSSLVASSATWISRAMITSSQHRVLRDIRLALSEVLYLDRLVFQDYSTPSLSDSLTPTDGETLAS